MKTQNVWTILNGYDNPSDLIKNFLFTNESLSNQVAEMVNNFNNELCKLLKDNADNVRLMHYNLCYPFGKQTLVYKILNDESTNECIVDTIDYLNKPIKHKEHIAFVYDDYNLSVASRKIIDVDFGDGKASSSMDMQNYLEQNTK